MERNMAIKKTLDEENFTGLSGANENVPAAQRVMWSDLVQGRPEIEDSLSSNAKSMKAEMYTQMFKNATDLDHSCRVSGSEYLRCVQENSKERSKARQMKCQPLFASFDACRKNVLESQARALESSLVK